MAKCSYGQFDVARDFVEVELHHVCVGVRQRESRPDAAGRADRAEQIGVISWPYFWKSGVGVEA